jgi:hypothetical protein
MRTALHILEPPPRQLLLEEVKEIDESLQIRLNASQKKLKETQAALKVHKYCQRWFNKVKQKKNVLFAAQEALRKERENINASYDEEDDMMSYASSLESKSIRSGGGKF